MTFDVFLSHASADKTAYVEPLSESLKAREVSFFLDKIEMSWGDNVPLRINSGLQQSKYAVICLSPRFLGRRWPEAELTAAFAMQTNTGEKRVLPLILDGKDEVLAAYPILNSLAYREYTTADTVANEMAALLGNGSSDATPRLKVVVESVHTGMHSVIRVPPNVSVRWLTDHAQQAAAVTTSGDVGAYIRISVRWVLVDRRAEDAWAELPRQLQDTLYAVVRDQNNKVVFSHSQYDQISTLGVYDGIVFHLHSVPNEGTRITASVDRGNRA
jgi:TIR domain-containing protein